ncbi:mono/diheme cytochrome c family protein [Lewinella marina]|uniref:Cytochrome C n=1 Tax=Neolewinella marina TaxID=438751 RepID=A0A2G0CH25_9BACT|nr:cytochrome c [Neolewinella marina]NJB86300.1 mono/diheme cytochrome c family protein [Neolewinella marina]PHK99230.1 cytochrome C [Neolewinella marina]
MKNLKSKVGLLVFCLFWGLGCGTPRLQVPGNAFEMPTADLESGRILFNEKCASCHPAGRAGVGPSIVNKPLPKFLIRFQVRHGLGVMPAFPEQILSDTEVRQIADYLAWLRRPSLATVDQE